MCVGGGGGGREMATVDLSYNKSTMFFVSRSLFHALYFTLFISRSLFHALYFTLFISRSLFHALYFTLFISRSLLPLSKLHSDLTHQSFVVVGFFW